MLIATFVVGAVTVTAPQPSGAVATSVSGDAYGHYTKVGLFGGPQGVVGPAPYVSLPPEGVDAPLIGREPNGAAAVFGPATIFGGKWPLDLGVAPPSGPVTVSTVGSPGPGGSVTSKASITLHPVPVPMTCDGQPPSSKNCTSPGGFGPVVPNEGDELHAECTADENGVRGFTRIVNGMLATSTDEGGEPKDQEKIPEYPAPNYERTGVITNVGDKWRIVYNEQVIEPDGSITVNALHMYLLGDIAVGDQILGHVRCSMNAETTSPTTAIKPNPNAPRPQTEGEIGGAAAAGGADINNAVTTADKGSSEAEILPLALAGGALAAGLAGAVIVSRRRRRAEGETLMAGGADADE